MHSARPSAIVALVDKTAIKSAKPSPRSGVALPLGAHPGNTGGKPGRSGRPPDAFKAFLAKLRANPKALAAVQRAALDETGRNFATAWKLASEYDETRPTGKLDVTSGGKPLQGVVILPQHEDDAG